MFQATMAMQEAERAVLRKAPSIGGLCRDCVNAPTCTFPRDPSRPIWFCDEFEPPASVPGSDQRVDPGTAGTETAEPEELKGLCRHCLRRPTCQFPKLPGGVWHCEEME